MILNREPPRTLRMVAIGLAAIWLGAAIGGVVIGASTERWLAVVFSLVAIWYGLVW